MTHEQRRRAVGYIRVSLEEMAEHGVSLEAQRARIAAYCAAAGLELLEVVEDPGASGKNLNRPGLQRALGMLGSAADTLVVAKLDRLTRSVHDWCHLADEHFRERDALRSASEQVDLSTASGRMFVGLLMLMAQFEREVIGERTSTAMQHKSDTGAFVGGKPPYGYSVDEAGKLQPVDAEQAVIAAARALRSQGKSLRAVAVALAEAGYAPRAGASFAPAQVARMVEVRPGVDPA